MAFDGGFLRSVVNEISEAQQSHIDKIYQPSRDELVFLLRKKGYAKRLTICIRSGQARMHFTEKKYENPATPPMFCMLARKHFSAARLTGISQYGLDRAVTLHFEATNEMGDRVFLRIICEFIGNKSNVILVGDDGRILDALRRSDIETADRIIQPGAVYEYPLSSGKINSMDNPLDALDKICENPEIPINKALLDSLEGVSPLVARELAFSMLSEDLLVRDCPKEKIVQMVEMLNKYLISGTPNILSSADGTPAEYCYMPINQYGGLYATKVHQSFSELLDSFYAERQAAAYIKHAAGDIIKLVDNLIVRTKKRMALRKKELKNGEDCEKYRIYGELIKANIHIIPIGADRVAVQNFYDENLAEITIPLSPALNAVSNATRYFKLYKKSHTAAGVLADFIKKDSEEIVYLESVRESIDRCKTAADITEIREELQKEGYIKALSQKKNKPQKSVAFEEYTSVEGFKIAVGKNNVQNDLLTLKIASKGDMWFHTKNIPGSHVVVFSGGEKLCDETINFAARLAAKNSKAANSSNVPVDYTLVKYVKKPAGGKAGMVIYTTNKTVFVTPETIESEDKL